VITLETAQRVLGTGNVRAVRDLIEALIDGDIPRGLHVINAAIDAGGDPRQFGGMVVEHLRAVLLAATASADLIEASSEDRAIYEQQAGQTSRAMLIRAIRTFNEAVNDLKGGWQPQLALELALIESIRGSDPHAEATEAPIARSATSPAPRAKSTPAEADLPPAEITPPGAPPVVPLIAIQEKWIDMLRALNRYSSTGPAVVEHFRPLRVEGNLITIATDKKLYYDRLNSPEKLNVLERAFTEVHRIRVRVTLALVDHLDPVTPGASDQTQEAEDPLLAEMRQLGGVPSADSPAPRGDRDAKPDADSN
jgi:DNA polymerase III gamma/tau subunit